ncbi:MAG: polysaccharide deacetylase family protein, partial [Oscillospiraceae bacterium]|nr:polysaccharide deacetylase family protein [Oscillospiraceae bacterium]
MYLTFDNGYEYENLTADILDTLKEKDVKAAFFVTLSYAKQNPELVRRMIDEGHIVGNHSATHPSFPKISRTEMAKEIAELDNYLVENFSYSSPYFRFPSGEYSECA